MRTNVRGNEVPAVLGLPLTAGGVAGVVVVAALLAATDQGTVEESIAVAWALVMMAAAGAWDDTRGDERPRGFSGHLGALRGSAVTGGIVKIVAAVVAGVFAAAFLPTRGANVAAHVSEVVALVGLSANLINLFDRAPGRAGKVSFLVAVPLMAFGDRGWVAAAAPVFAALAVTLFFDLREQAMLGDGGANPVGAVLGVGLAASLDEPGRLAAIAILLVFNLASEKWSFSKAIEATPPLRWFDGLGCGSRTAPD
jgi:UDP-N-acetylmuramyl pentapeptide phosphotransferase/UDP-N-acetylglucosamine-1-phosphate transferase